MRERGLRNRKRLQTTDEPSRCRHQSWAVGESAVVSHFRSWRCSPSAGGERTCTKRPIDAVTILPSMLALPNCHQQVDKRSSVTPRLRGRQRAPEERLRSPRHPPRTRLEPPEDLDRKSTRLNSSHGYISYAVFCLKKKTA